MDKIQGPSLPKILGPLPEERWPLPWRVGKGAVKGTWFLFDANYNIILFYGTEYMKINFSFEEVAKLCAIINVRGANQCK